MASCAFVACVTDLHVRTPGGGRRRVQPRESNVHERLGRRGTAVASVTPVGEGLPMLMFKREQLYIGFALAALAEIIVRAVAR